jgi:hypothetical protein
VISSIRGWTLDPPIVAAYFGRIWWTPPSSLGSAQKNGQTPKDIILTRAMGESYHFQPIRWASVNTFLHAEKDSFHQLQGWRW